MNQLPKNIINKIFLYLSHPIASIIKEEIDEYECIDYDYDLSNSNYDFFYEYYFCKYYIKNSCDCCSLSNRECTCICYNCSDDYKTCKMKCLEDPPPLIYEGQ